MNEIKTTAELNDAIYYLELKNKQDAILLNVEFHRTIDSLKPLNLIKHQVETFIKQPNLANNLINTGLSMAGGYISKKAIFGTSPSAINSVIGNIMQVGLTGFLANNADDIKQKTIQLIRYMLLPKKSKSINP